MEKVLEELPLADNAGGAVEKMLRANAILRHLPWPKPFDETSTPFPVRGRARPVVAPK